MQQARGGKTPYLGGDDHAFQEEREGLSHGYTRDALDLGRVGKQPLSQEASLVRTGRNQEWWKKIAGRGKVRILNFSVAFQEKTTWKSIRFVLLFGNLML